MRVDRRQSPQAAPEAPRRSGRGGGSVPADLRRRFIEFRRANAPMTRVPDDLRVAVLRAFDQGASMTSLRRELDLTVKQVENWRRYAPAGFLEGGPATGRGGARIFDVADGSAVGEHASASGDVGEALELRLGAWSVVIRGTCS
jgi:transposase-like protein